MELLLQEKHPALFSQSAKNGILPSYPQKKGSNYNRTDILCSSHNIKSYVQKDENPRTQMESYPYPSMWQNLYWWFSFYFLYCSQHFLKLLLLKNPGLQFPVTFGALTYLYNSLDRHYLLLRNVYLLYLFPLLQLVSFLWNISFPQFLIRLFYFLIVCIHL